MFLSNIERNPWHKNGLSETTRILGKLNLNFFFYSFAVPQRFYTDSKGFSKVIKTINHAIKDSVKVRGFIFFKVCLQLQRFRTRFSKTQFSEISLVSRKWTHVRFGNFIGFTQVDTCQISRNSDFWKFFRTCCKDKVIKNCFR